MALHVTFCLRKGLENLTVCSNDKNVVVILVDQFPRVLNIFPGENAKPQLPVKFPKYHVPINILENKEVMLNFIAFIHCISESDTMCCFFFKGNQTFFASDKKSNLQA